MIVCLCNLLDLHAFLSKIFNTYLNTTNRKQNRIGFLLLKSIFLLDIAEYTPPSPNPLHIQPLRKYMWKEGAMNDNVKQSDGNQLIQMDGVHCVLERYFVDIMKVCVAFYGSEDVIIRVRQHGDRIMEKYCE